MMFPQHERALLPGDPGAFKRRRLSSISDGNKNAATALLSFKKSEMADDGDASVSSLFHYFNSDPHQHSSPPILAVNANNHQKEGGGQSFSSTSTGCSSVTYNTASAGKQGDFCQNEIISNGATILDPDSVPAWKSSKSSPPLSFLHMAMAQPPNLPMAATTRGAGSMMEYSMTLPAGRPLSPPPRLPTSMRHKQR